MTDPRKENTFKILGQEFPYPETIWAAIGLSVFCLSVVAVVYLVLISASSEKLTLVTQAVYQWNGKQLTRPEETRLVAPVEEQRRPTGSDHL